METMTIVEISLLFFFVLFLGIVARLVFSRSKRWKEDAQIPLHDTVAIEPESSAATEGVHK
jgi:hypothetical protein